MGDARWSTQDWAQYNMANVAGKTQQQVFRSTSLKPEYDPRHIEIRESRDSASNPASTPIILASDVTGSMGMIAHELMQTGLDTVAREIYDRKPVSDPHIMVMAVGDAKSDQAPLQTTQFEADIRLADQVRDLWLEGNGGGNGGESYCLAHVFAGAKVSADAWEKRRKKGYLFTIGDEPVHDGVTAQELERVMGKAMKGMDGRQCVALASQTFELFHVVLMNEGHAGQGDNRRAEVLRSWERILPERIIKLDDRTKLGEAIVSAIQVTEGAAKADVAASWGSGTDLVIASAIRDLAARQQAAGAVRL